ncbi:inhibitor of nuclear factor kappa-B kinase-interacting protein isoform X1 [Pygocentrus nattereri]|uniref:IKBKB interacting protein n=1 Tax=Pygocentrus nattereri TaxID=42514 RepID=A0A3B4DGI7_PYGNA|nr:inhibitor of nuclear factor kappa-B kinase-interacting protein isoform X1 [Pygocentrus nattereri]
MPSSEVKHRKAKTSVSHDGETNGTSKPSSREEGKKDGAGPSEQNRPTAGRSGLCSSLDLRTTVSFLSLSACCLLAGVVVHQNARFNDVEEKYRQLYEKAANLLVLEEKMGAVSKKLEASEDHLKGALSSITLVTRLEHDITSLNAVVTAMQEDQDASTRHLQGVNERFQNVTEEWQSKLGTVTDELVSLRSESRLVHGRVTEQVNDAEGRLHALTERLEELEDGTRRNARLLERTEEEDAQQVQSQLDWNTRQVTRLQEQLKQLSRNDIELQEKLEETEPKAKECEAQLPTVEDAVRSILKLGADLSSTERRLEELTFQVLGTEDSMLKALAEILELRQALDDLQVDNSVKKMSSELGVVLEAMKELEHLQREQDLYSRREELQPGDGKDFERLDLKDLHFENVKQLSNALKDLEKNVLLEPALDHSDGQTTGTEEDPLAEFDELL